MSSKIYPTLIIVFALFQFNIPGFAQNEITILEVGKAIERELKGGEKHTFRINAASNQFLHLAAMQNGIDVVVSFLAPDGTKLLDVDSPNGVRGPEPFWFVIENAGQYTVEVGSLESEAKAGKYEIKINELRNASSDDRHYTAAKKIIQEGINIGNTRDEAARTKAIEKYQEAARLYGLIESDKQLKAAGFLQMGRLFGANRMNELALSYFDRSAAIYDEAGLKKDAINAMIGGQGYAMSQIDYIARNEKIKAMGIAIGDRKTEASALIQIGTGYYNLGDFSKALQSNLSALAIAREIGDDSRVERTYDNIGAVYTAQGNFGAALESHQTALEMQNALGNARPKPATILNIGNVYVGLGNYELALENYQKALGAFEKMRSPDGVAYATSNIGSVYLETGRYEQALEYFLKAQPMKAKFLPDDPTSLYNIASVYRATGRFNDAMEYTTKASELCKKIADTDCMTRNLIETSDIFWAQGDFAKALESANEAITLAKKYDYATHVWTAYLSAANAQLGLGKSEDARHSLEASIFAIDQLRTKITGDETSSRRFFEGKSDPFRRMIELLVESKQEKSAFSFAERIKARALLDVLGSGKLDIAKAMTPKELAAENSLKNELASLNLQVSNESDKSKSQSLEILLHQKRLELEDFKTRIYSTHPELRAQRGEMIPIALEEVGNLLPEPNSAVVEYAVTENSVFLFVISKGGKLGHATLKTYSLKTTAKDLAARVENFRSKLANGDLDFPSEAQELYRLLLKPAAAQLAGKTNLIVVPDGPLWDLPFQAMQIAPGKYLVETAAVSYAPSLTALREMKKKSRTRRAESELLAFGNPAVGRATAESVKRVFMSEKLEPLPEAERLVNSLKQMYGANRAKIFTGAEAREETAKTESPKFRIVQFAAHGILNDASPMYSHIVLSQKENNPNEDGLLEAWEMKDLDLKADMVILSACETARGRISNGEGVIGMSWALFIAGTPTTVASQWKVESSSTTELMLEFHRQLLNKKPVSKAEALRRASLKLMKMPKFRHPSYWAGFAIVGDGS